MLTRNEIEVTRDEVKREHNAKRVDMLCDMALRSLSERPKQGETPRTPAVEALLSYTQADPDGVFVNVSRQAIHEVVEELAQKAKRVSELEAKDALPISPDLIEAQSLFQINITFHSSRERNEFYRWLIERFPAAERKEAGRAVRCHESLLLAVRQSIAALECGGGVGHEVARLREAAIDAERKDGKDAV